MRREKLSFHKCLAKTRSENVTQLECFDLRRFFHRLGALGPSLESLEVPWGSFWHPLGDPLGTPSRSTCKTARFFRLLFISEVALRVPRSFLVVAELDQNMKQMHFICFQLPKVKSLKLNSFLCFQGGAGCTSVHWHGQPHPGASPCLNYGNLRF